MRVPRANASRLIQVKLRGAQTTSAGCGVVDEVLDLAGLVGGVQRHVDQAGAQHGQVQHHGLDRLVHVHQHARAGGQREVGEQVGDARAAALEVAPGVVQRRERMALVAAGRVGGLDGDVVQALGEVRRAAAA